MGASTGYSSVGGGSTGYSYATAPAPVTVPMVAPAPVYAAPVYSAPMTYSPVTTYSPMSSYFSESSYPVGDYGFVPGYPTEVSNGMGFPVGSTMSTPIYDSGIQGVPVDGGIVPVESAPVEGLQLENGFGNEIQLDGGIQPTADPNIYYNQPTDAPGMVPGGIEAPGPIEGDDSTSLPSSVPTYAVLKVVVPESARVLINDKPTATKGSVRSYVSRGLKEDRDYKFRVTAIFEEDGNEIRRTKIVRLRPGLKLTQRFEFESPVVTRLALSAPVDAKVTLCGKPMAATGKLERSFETTSLAKGDSWDNYKIEVEYEQDGVVQKEVRTIDIVAGKSHSVSLGLNEKSSADFDRVASR
jgi:uncharacterized protein (TIGR03000 family)